MTYRNGRTTGDWRRHGRSCWSCWYCICHLDDDDDDDDNEGAGKVGRITHSGGCEGHSYQHFVTLYRAGSDAAEDAVLFGC